MRKYMEQAYLDRLKFRDLPKNTLKGTKFRENCQNTDLRKKQLVSELAQLITVSYGTKQK